MAWNRRAFVSLACAAGAIVSGASAQEMLQFDIDGLTAECDNPFSEDYTGRLHIYNTILSPDPDFDTSIVEVLIDGTSQNTGGADASEFAFEIIADFVDGSVTGGTIMLSLNATGSENTYTSNLVATDRGSILDIGGGTFILGAEFAGGDRWTNPSGTALGVDVSPWASADGFYTQIDLNFDGLMDMDTDVDVFFVVPTPASLGVLAMGGLLASRRRR